MANSTDLYGNMTGSPASKNMTNVIVKSAFFMVMLSCFLCFLYFVAIMLRAYFTTPDVRESSRHILFIHLMVNDTVFLTIGLFLYIASVHFVYLPVPLCYTIITFSSSTLRVTPYHLAAMSLERYVAICFPLRHIQLCTVRRTNIAIAVLWIMGLIPNLVELMTLNSSVDKEFYSLNVICSAPTLTRNPLQDTIRLLSIIISFILVGLVILFTYIKVVLVARKISSNKSTAKKAGTTIGLHAFQLLLCMTSFTSSFTEAFLQKSMQFMPMINFLLFMCLPRFLSPFIYGMKDNVFRKHVKNICNIKY